MAEPNTDATGITTMATSYEEAVKSTAGRRAATDWPGTPVPDTPTGAVHLNPALNPAPIKEVIPERIPVPVVNDPGVVGANPPLGALNAAYRADAMGVAVDDLPPTEAGMVTLEDIKSAAQGTQTMIAERVDEVTTKSIDASQNKPVSVIDDANEDGPQSGDLTKSRKAADKDDPKGSSKK